MILQASGYYFSPGSAHCTEATISLSPDGSLLRVHGKDGTPVAEAWLRQVTATSRLGALRRKLYFPDGGCFETTDNDAVDVLLKRGSGLLHRLEKSWRIVLGSLVVVAASVAWFLIYGAPLAADWLARQTPPAVSTFMTNQTLAALDGEALRPTALPPKIRKKDQDLFAAVAAHETRPASSYRLFFRNAPVVGPNAFALPDGTIVLTDQLANMIRDDSELEGVFAHEMSHVNHAHVLQRVYQASLVPAAIAFVTGDASQVSHFATILPGVLLQSAYSRAFEQQADDDAALVLRRMRLDPGKLAGLLERMEKAICGGSECAPSWLGSHPATQIRAARLRRAPEP